MARYIKTDRSRAPVAGALFPQALIKARVYVYWYSLFNRNLKNPTTMDRNEIDKETKGTRNTKNIVYWVVGAFLILLLIAYLGGVFNHNNDVTPNSSPVRTDAVHSDTVAGDQNVDNKASDIRNR
jgi:hypothetical protein